MLNLRVIWVGRGKSRFIREAIAHYLERIRTLAPLEWVELRPAAHSGRDPQTAIQAESTEILKQLRKNEVLLLLDVQGQQPSSPELAQLLDALNLEGAGRICFVLGGAHGVDARVKARARQRLSLSRLTFPHQLARVMLLEQIYRALSLRANHGYHHG